jgi:hypothetical protein
MNIKTLTSLATKLPPHIAILMRGPTGVGKSQVARGIAAELELPYIDVRGSTMDESDMGIPDLVASKEAGCYTKMLPSWYVRACREPVVLMLDELNRAMPSVMQAFFQVVLDRELGNGPTGEAARLHPETRVIAAINHGTEYDVNEMDPALLRRFWVCDLEPTSEDWIEWAKGAGIDDVMIDFIRQEPAHWRVDPSKVEAGTVTPTPASWHRLDETLKYCGWHASSFAGKGTPDGFYSLALGLVGTEAAISFTDFVKNYELVISAEDVLSGEVTAEDVKDQQAGDLNNVIDKLAEHCKDNTWSMTEATKVAAFGKSLGGELMVQLWNKVSSSNNLPNIQKLHKKMGTEVVKAVQASRNLK